MTHKAGSTLALKKKKKKQLYANFASFLQHLQLEGEIVVFCYHVTTWFGAVLSQYVKRAWINEENALVCISVIKRSKLDDVKQVLAKGNTEHLKCIVTFKMNKLWIETNICTVRKQLTLTSSSGGTERLHVRSWLVVSGSFGCSADP